MARNSSAGAQTLDRAAALLRQLGAAGGAGLRLIEIQNAARLTRPTAHRILAALARHGLVEQDSESRRYRLGREVAILGWSVARRGLDLRGMFDAEMHDLAQDTGDCAFLLVRSGFDTVCINLKMGPFPIKALTVDIGTRRPLGVGAGGIALLASLDPEEQEEVYAAIKGRLHEYRNVSERVIRAAVREACEKGYGFSDGHVLGGVRGLAVAVRDPSGTAVAALSIAAIRERVGRDRIPMLVRALDKRRRAVERKLAIAPRA
jgi:DNA-binding IclR family transcriptional regulator